MSDRRHLVQLARIALLVAVVDLATKAAAKAFLVQEPGSFTSTLQLAVVHNNAGAFGWSAGAYTWQLNLALTLSAIVFMVPVTRDLARIDGSAPRALGLIVGGALGNLASLVTSPSGVIDFIAINFEKWGIVLNVADVAAYAGLVMILRTGFLIGVAILRDRRAPSAQPSHPVRAVFSEPGEERLRRRRTIDGWVPRRELEIAVGGHGAIAGDRPLLADAAPAQLDDAVVFDIESARRKRPLIDDIARPLSHESPQAPPPPQH